MKYLIDTDVITELIKDNPNSKVVDLIDSIEQDDLYISVMSISLIFKGIQKVERESRRRELEKWFFDLLDKFGDNIIPFDTENAIRWGEISANLEKKGMNIPYSSDMIIIASALSHDLILITNHDEEFKNTGVNTINPWTNA